MNPIALWPTIALLLAATVTDLRSRRIPNVLVLPFLVVGIVSSGIAGGWRGLGQSLLGMLAAAIVMGTLHLLGGMGMGDVKLFAAVGAWIGPSQLLIALVMTGLAGGVMALLWAAAKGFLGEALRGTAGLIFGREKKFSDSTHAMPYAPAIAVGTMLSFLGRHI